jgi:hypothetical protein
VEKSVDETEKRKKRKNRIIVLIIITIFIIIDVFMFIYIYAYNIHPPEPVIIWGVSTNQTKIEDGYIIDIISIAPSTSGFKPSFLEWRIIINGTITYYERFPLIHGENGSSTHKNITIIWFDNDQNKKLSINDTIQINSYSLNFSGYQFRIMDKSEKWPDLIMDVELE